MGSYTKLKSPTVHVRERERERDAHVCIEKKKLKWNHGDLSKIF